MEGHVLWSEVLTGSIFEQIRPLGRNCFDSLQGAWKLDVQVNEELRKLCASASGGAAAVAGLEGLFSQKQLSEDSLRREAGTEVQMKAKRSRVLEECEEGFSDKDSVDCGS